MFDCEEKCKIMKRKILKQKDVRENFTLNHK